MNKPELKELSEEQAQQVPGGFQGDWRTVMECSDKHSCCYVTEWLGDYRKQGPFVCPICYCQTLWGTDKYYQG